MDHIEPPRKRVKLITGPWSETAHTFLNLIKNIDLDDDEITNMRYISALRDFMMEQPYDFYNITSPSIDEYFIELINTLKKRTFPDLVYTRIIISMLNRFLLYRFVPGRKFELLPIGWICLLSNRNKRVRSFTVYPDTLDEVEALCKHGHCFIRARQSHAASIMSNCKYDYGISRRLDSTLFKFVDYKTVGAYPYSYDLNTLICTDLPPIHPTIRPCDVSKAVVDTLPESYVSIAVSMVSKDPLLLPMFPTSDEISLKAIGVCQSDALKLYPCLNYYHNTGYRGEASGMAFYFLHMVQWQPGELELTWTPKKIINVLQTIPLPFTFDIKMHMDFDEIVKHFHPGIQRHLYSDDIYPHIYQQLPRVIMRRYYLEHNLVRMMKYPSDTIIITKSETPLKIDFLDLFDF